MKKLKKKTSKKATKKTAAKKATSKKASAKSNVSKKGPAPVKPVDTVVSVTDQNVVVVDAAPNSAT